MTTPEPKTVYRAVTFDLFGTLVNAPSAQDRAQAANELADAFAVDSERVHQALSQSWRDRHLGNWATVPDTVANLARLCESHRPDLARAADLVRQRARRRLDCDQDVLAMLSAFIEREIPVAMLSDAAVETAEAWPHCALATLNLPVFFSCKENAVKPAPQLYQRVLDTLNVPAEHVLYCGDGGGDELAGAQRAGMHPIGVHPRGYPATIAHSITGWSGPIVSGVEQVSCAVLRLAGHGGGQVHDVA